ncbi:MAG TPA: SDR family oxidoreductase [Thermoleophilaceae bacterium]|nr:SDR family oxidoreductase [Thermoleophilaceae bacterium]
MSRVLITGAGGAFGRAATAALRERGAQVAGLDLRPDSAEGVLECDITDPEAAVRGVGEAVDALGGLDVVVNNAGLGGPASAGAAPDERARQMVEVNLFGAWNVTAAAIEELVRARGRVVFVASRMSFLGLPLAASYAVSKRGLVAYADCVRAEYGTHVSVSCIHPAMVRTPIHDSTAAAGLSLEGVSSEEPLEGVVARIVAASLDPRPPRDAAVTRAGRVQLLVARHLPGLVDRVVARQVAKQVRSGAFDQAPLADGLRSRHGR